MVNQLVQDVLGGTRQVATGDPWEIHVLSTSKVTLTATKQMVSLSATNSTTPQSETACCDQLRLVVTLGQNDISMTIFRLQPTMDWGTSFM